VSQQGKQNREISFKRSKLCKVPMCSSTNSRGKSARRLPRSQETREQKQVVCPYHPTSQLKFPRPTSSAHVRNQHVRRRSQYTSEPPQLVSELTTRVSRLEHAATAAPGEPHGEVDQVARGDAQSCWVALDLGLDGNEERWSKQRGRRKRRAQSDTGRAALRW
jgi:hypothetical protein